MGRTHNVCYECGMLATELHHIMFRSQMKQLENCKLNFVYLCPECHRGTNEREIDITGGRKMNPQALIERLDQCIVALGRGNTQMKTLGLEKAKTERDYKVRQAQEILKLKADKYPATLIMELVKENEEVAELRLQRDIAESAYFVGLEAMNNLRLEIEIVRSKLTWLRNEMNNG